MAGIVVLCFGPWRDVCAQERWRLSEAPILTIGSTDGTRNETFYDIRGLLRTDTGDLVVADGGTSELRVYTAAGKFLRAFGGPGDGPREFRTISWIDPCGGPGFAAYDSRRHRVTRWDAEGSLLAEFRIDGPRDDVPPYAVRCDRSGSFVVIGWPDMGAISPRLGPYRAPVGVGVTDRSGRIERRVGDFPAGERLRLSGNDRPHPFGRPTTIDIDEGDVFVGTADSFYVEVIGPNGDRRTVGVDRPVAPLTEAEKGAWVDDYMERAGAPRGQRPALRRAFLDSPWLPDVAPAYADFTIDRTGLIWMAPYVIGGPTDALVPWVVLDRDGSALAIVDIPRSFRPVEIGADYVLGISVDVLDVERVALFALYR